MAKIHSDDALDEEALIDLVGLPLSDHRFKVEKLLEAITAVSKYVFIMNVCRITFL